MGRQSAYKKSSGTQIGAELWSPMTVPMPSEKKLGLSRARSQQNINRGGSFCIPGRGHVFDTYFRSEFPSPIVIML
jgi:hypothetical protein